VANEELVNYIKGQLEQCKQEDEIRAALVANGWKDADLNEAFDFIFAQAEDTQKTTATNPTIIKAENHQGDSATNYIENKIIARINGWLKALIVLFILSVLFFFIEEMDFNNLIFTICIFIVLLFLIMIIRNLVIRHTSWKEIILPRLIFVATTIPVTFYAIIYLTQDFFPDFFLAFIMIIVPLFTLVLFIFLANIKNISNKTWLFLVGFILAINTFILAFISIPQIFEVINDVKGYGILPSGEREWLYFDIIPLVAYCLGFYLLIKIRRDIYEKRNVMGTRKDESLNKKVV
jgi:hypothetical protein